MKTELLELKYLEVILRALSKFYSRDYELIEQNEGVHEQTFTSKLAYYLEQELENRADGCFIDCEYSRDKFAEDHRKAIYASETGQKRHVRPDIIYHDRDLDNQFCIEGKWDSMQGDDKKFVTSYSNIDIMKDIVFIMFISHM